MAITTAGAGDHSRDVLLLDDIPLTEILSIGPDVLNPIVDRALRHIACTSVYTPPAGSFQSAP